MKAFYKIGLIGFFLCIAGNTFATFHYTFRADNWVFGSGITYTFARFTYHMENDDTGVVILSPGTSSVSFDTESRIISVDRHIEYTQYGVTVIDDYSNLLWSSSDMHMYPGSSPLWPVLYYITYPAINIVAKQDGVTLTDGSMIDFGKAIQIEVTRNGYPGPLPIYFGSSSALSNNVLFTIPEGASSYSVVLSDHWSQLSALFGGDYAVVNKLFYLGFKYKVNEYGVIAQTNILNYKLSGNLITTPAGARRLCTSDTVGLTVEHLEPPYTVSIKQGTSPEKTFTFDTPSTTLNYNTIKTEGDTARNFEIYVYHTGTPSVRTKRIYLFYLRKPPNITNFAVTPEDVSCIGKTDGKLTISLPNESASESFRYSISGQPNIEGDRDITAGPYASGNYNITVEYKYSNPADYGCFADLGTHNIGVKPKLVITNISEKPQSCSYKSDATFTITTSNGVGDIDYILNGDTSKTNTVGSLSPDTDYSIHAIDSKGCPSNTISKKPVAIAPLVITQNKTDIRCFGETGSVTLTGSGGHNSFEFSLDGSSYSTNNIFSDIQGNTNHILEMRDATLSGESCVTSVPIFFEEPPELLFRDTSYTVSNYNGYNIKCHGENSGQILLNHSGGTTPINFKLNNVSESFEQLDDPDFKNLVAGVYNASISDANGCSTILDNSIELTEPEGITFSNIVVTSETCNGTKDASISMNLSSVADSLQWYMSGNPLMYENKSLLENLVPGVYRLEAFYNSNACTGLSDFIPVNAVTPINYTATYHESCSNGDGGGEIRINGVTNGRQPLTYVFNNGTSNALSGFPIIFGDLDPGEYTLEVRDSAYIMGGIYEDRCKASQTFSIFPKNTPVVIPVYTHPLCYGDSNGAISVSSLTGSDNPILHTWLNINNDSIGSGGSLNGIPAGKYSIVIKDDYQCKTIQTGFVVNQPNLLAMNSISIENAACTGIADGQLTVTASGGTFPYQYSSNAGLTWQANPSLINLTAGTYEVRLRDNHNCLAYSLMTVDAFVPVISMGADYDSISCYNSADGAYTLTASGSKSQALGFSYYLLGNPVPASTGVFSDLDAGTHRFYAIDHEGCYTDTLTGIVYEPHQLNVDLILRDSSSCGQYTGKIGYSITGGNGNFKMLWSNIAIGETTYLDYTLVVTDRKGCEAMGAVFIPDRTAPHITNIQLLDSTWCNRPLGSVKVNVTGGSPQYTYSWDNSDADKTAIADHLTEGIYHVLVTDRYNCHDSSSIILTNGPEIALTSTIEMPHCGQKDGNVSLTVTGGVGPFLFQWPDSISADPVSLPLMDNLYAGNYPVDVSDNVGCIKRFLIALSDLNGPAITSVNISKAWCGLPRGTAQVFATGGLSPYSYFWMHSTGIIGNNAYVDGLKAGNYSITITDPDNCRAIKNIEITDSLELKPLLLLASLDSAACNKPLGKLSVAMSKGLAPYTYQWNNGIVTDSLINIVRGTYRVTATDQRGCRDSLELQLPDRQAPVMYLLSKESAYCGKPSGTATVYASLGRAPYQTYLTIDPADKTPLAFNISQHHYMGTIDSLLPLPTPYRIGLSDANGCESPEIGVLINDNNPLSFNLTDIAPVSCYGLSDGKAIVTAGNGFEPYTYEWNANMVNNNTNSSLPAGPFSVKVTDAKECTKTLYVTATPITQPQPVSVSPAYITQPSCFGICNGTITAIATGGNGNFTYVWNNADTAQSGTNLCSGANVLKITDAKGCNLISTYTLVNPAPLTGTNLPDSATVCSGQHYFADPGIEWANVSWVSDNSYTSTNHIADITAQGVYYMSGYSQKGCKVTDTIRVIISNDLLDAQFLMMSQAYTGDTVVIIEVSWPVADEYLWDLPKSASLVYDNANHKELIFSEPGNYYIQLTARLAGCSSVTGKYIEVLDDYENQEVQVEPQKDPPLIKSFGIYPNPADMDFNIDVKLNEESAIRVEIINVNSSILNRVINDYGLDNYLVNMNIDGLMPGTYVVRLIAGNESKTKILIVK
jgi:hypothetical protein